MLGTLKRKVLTLSIIASSLLIGCNSNEEKKSTDANWREIQGETQGTTYGLIFDDPNDEIQKEALDSILHDFDLALSSYIDNSIVTHINNASDSITFEDPHGYFQWCYEKSQEVFNATNGAFDPSVFPLVKAWGFFGDSLLQPSQEQLDSILNFVGFGKPIHACTIGNDTGIFTKGHPSFRMDFNAIAQGYSVDVLAQYLEVNGIKDYYIEIGGEIVVSGKNREGKDWRIGIDSPEQEATNRVIENVVNISDKAIATSGNYRKFYLKDGVKYAHTINPKTGAPVQHSLLSATVIASSCADADAYATAFMVVGVEESKRFVKEHPELGLEMYLLYDDGSGSIERTMTKGFKKFIQ